MATRQKRRSGVDWFPSQAEAGSIASLAAGAQATVLDIEIENRNTGVAYGSGAIVGLRAWANVLPAAVTGDDVYVVCMIIPAGLTVPSVLSAAELKRAEQFLWFHKLMKPTSALSATTCMLIAEVEIGSARRFNQADRLVFVVVNQSATAFGAGALAGIAFDSYVRED